MSTINHTTGSSLPLSPGTWAIDPAHSAVNFAIRHLGVSKVRGRFTRFAADVVVGDTLATSSVTARVDVASVDTGNADRDAHVLAPDMLDVAVRPTLELRSTSIRGEGSDWELVGDLTIGAVTAPLTLEVELGGIEVFPADGRRHAGFEARGAIRRHDFGLIPAVPAAFLGEVVTIELDLQLVEPPRTAG